MPQLVHQHQFPNGLTLLAERMEHVRSAAMVILVPAGCAYDPPGSLGLAGVLSDMITRGAGDRDSRELTLALDNLGLDRGESVGLMHTRFSAATLARNLPTALRLYADILRRPHLPEDELESCQALAIQDIKGLEDEPGSRVMVELKRHYLPRPLSNDHRGTVEGIESLSPIGLKLHHQKMFHPAGTILSVAGNIDWDATRDLVGELFGDWAGSADLPLDLGPLPAKRGHLTKELEQTQVAVAHPSVPVGHEDFYLALGASAVLDGGMASRLFTEVREKRGLCYSVGTYYAPMKDRGSMVSYVASLNHQAQEALDVLLAELQRLTDGIADEEIERVKVGLKTKLIMAQESTGARASSLASDWYNLGRLRSFDEIQAAIQGLTAARVVDHVRRHPAGDFSIVTLGPSPLTAA